MRQKTAFVTGITGQDGAYLAQFLLQKNYRVVGATRRASTLNLPRLAELKIASDVDLMTLDVQDFTSIVRMLDDVCPDEIYHLGGQSSVQASFQQPLYTAQTTGSGTLRMLQAIQLVAPQARFYHASSSEIFGQSTGQSADNMVNETTSFKPNSPYGVAKLFAHWSIINQREAYGLHAGSGIMFNHESPMRGMEFVTRKITTSLAQIACGSQQVLTLGNLDNARDWGFAGDYVEAMWLMLQQEKADDYVIATGRTKSVRSFVELTAEVLGMALRWEGEGADCKGVDSKSGRVLVAVDQRFYRPSEPNPLCGDASKARKLLGWQPAIKFETLVQMMAEADLQRARNGQVWY
ncbi:MAG: GDP-mannose 4,6-dehydratase [Parvibaculales bacterium]